MKGHSAAFFRLMVLLLCGNGLSAQNTNTFLGYQAMNFSGPGSTYNVAIGWFALTGGVSQTGYNNTAVGAAAFMNATSECGSTAIGCGAMKNSIGAIGNNVAVGAQALQGSISGGNSGSYNTVIGVNGMRNNTTGIENTASGYYSMNANSSGGYNTANGAYSLYSNSTASYNTARRYMVRI